MIANKMQWRQADQHWRNSSRNVSARCRLCAHIKGYNHLAGCKCQILHSAEGPAT